MKRVIYLFVVAIFLSNNLWAGVGTTGAAFLKIGVGARPIGMGSAYTALANGVSAIYWNPAGLANLEKREVSAMYSEWISDIRYSFLGYGNPIRKGTVGASLVYLSMGDMEKRGEGREKEGSFGASDLAATLSYSRQVSKSTSLGINLKIIHQRIEEETATGIALDLGNIYKTPIKNLSLGITIQNIGPKMVFIKEGYPLPLTFTIGTGYNIASILNLALDVKHQLIEGRTNICFGTEYLPFQVFALRCGYLARFLKSGINLTSKDQKLGDVYGLGGGLGFKFLGCQLDYAFIPFGALGDTHRISFSVSF